MRGIERGGESVREIERGGYERGRERWRGKSVRERERVGMREGEREIVLLKSTVVGRPQQNPC